mmetsp:Transcript_25445/g.36468  ORF Transcript_25445/g.36468 Transcript_25445/m.36468 type:complete len:157 (+) Transcript_25445:1431-1901(+)
MEKGSTNDSSKSKGGISAQLPTIVVIEPLAEGRIVGAPVLLMDAAADGDNVGTVLIRIGEGIADSLFIGVADGDNVFTSTLTIGESGIVVFEVVFDDGFGTWIGWRVLALKCIVVVGDDAPVAVVVTMVVGDGALVAEVVGDGELVSFKAKRLGLT